MRHRVDHRKLGRTAAHRKAMLRSMVTSLFKSERITTTSAKAKEARRLAEKLITRAKKGHAAHQGGDAAAALAHWRQAARYVRRTDVLRKLFDEIAPLYMERNGGYTRIIRMGNRLGDNARQVMLELVDTTVTLEPHAKGGAAGAESDKKKGKKESGSKAKAKAKPKDKAKTKTKDKAKKEEKEKKEAKKKTKAKPKSKSKSKSKAKSGTKTKKKTKAKD